MTAQNLVSNLHSSLKRATEFLVVSFFFTNFTFIPLLYLLLFFYTVLFTPFWWVALLYGGYIYIQSGQCELPKSEPKEAIRNHWFFNNYGDYFPVNLHKTADLPKDKNYLFGWHPHGILGFGAGVTICGRGPEFVRLFPGITRHVATLDVHFVLPFRRWLMEAFGFVPVSFKSLVFKLSKETGGNAVIVAIGGAEEALEAHHDVYKLCLNRRKGFIKVCLATGAHLVPVYAFGETSTYDQVKNPQGSTLRNFQETVKKYTGVSPPVVFGTSLIPYLPGILPRRAEINVVFGAPIPIEKTESPSKEKIEELHNLYKEKLVELFEANKLKFGVDKDAHLEFY